MPDHCPRAKAMPTGLAQFTLIELLVVVAIIAVLASLLLPALAKARDMSKRTKCLNTVKSCTLATLLYTDDNDGFAHPFWGSDNGEAGPVPGLMLRGYLPRGPGSYFTALVKAGFACPNLMRAEENAVYSKGYTGGYHVLEYMSYQNLATPWFADKTYYVRLTTVKRAERISFWGEGSSQGAQWGWTHPSWISLTAATQGAVFRHADTGNLGFLDGHAGTFARSRISYWPNNEILEKDRPDL